MSNRFNLFRIIVRSSLQSRDTYRNAHSLSRHLIPFHRDDHICSLSNTRTSKQYYCSNTVHEHTPNSPENTIGKITPKLFLAFTCKICNTRVEKHISKTAYTKGVVIVKCDKCEENHLIADNLGWFPNLKAMKNIEDIMASKGETVKKTIENKEDS